jgi:uncharacterized membrane protein
MLFAPSRQLLTSIAKLVFLFNFSCLFSSLEVFYFSVLFAGGARSYFPAVAIKGEEDGLVCFFVVTGSHTNHTQDAGNRGTEKHHPNERQIFPEYGITFSQNKKEFAFASFLEGGKEGCCSYVIILAKLLEKRLTFGHEL